MSETKLTTNEIDSSVKSKVIVFTRDGTAASADVAVTGVGFKPTSVIVFMNVDGTLYRSEGMSSSDGSRACTYFSAANVSYENNSQLMTYSNQSGWAQNGYILSYDTDGFTIRFVKIGTVPAGTMKIKALCFR